MNYRIKGELSDEEIKWYYQGKMLDDADELGVYDEYLQWLTRHRNVKDIERMSDFFDSAFSNIEAYPDNEHRRIATVEHVKERLTKNDSKYSVTKQKRY